MFKVLFLFSQNHAEFRLSEFESICKLLDIKIIGNIEHLTTNYLSVFNFHNLFDVQKILSRSVLIKTAFELFEESSTHENLIDKINKQSYIFKKYNDTNLSWALRFYSPGKKYDNNYRIEIMTKYAKFMKLDNAKIDLKNPINEFCIIEKTIDGRINLVYYGRLEKVKATSK